MKKFKAYIFSQEEIQDICGRQMPIDEETNTLIPDVANDWGKRIKLEEHIRKPVISIRPASNKAHSDGTQTDILVICAKGNLDLGVPTIKGNFGYIKECLLYISREIGHTPAETLNFYDYRTDEKDEKALMEWLHDEYGYTKKEEQQT